MTFPRLLIMITIFLFGMISLAAFFQNPHPSSKAIQTTRRPIKPIEISLNQPILPPLPTVASPSKEPSQEITIAASIQEPLPETNCIDRLFTLGNDKLPIVETITYKSKTSWQTDRPAWLSDYARYYQTSRHFIARSLNNNTPDYFKQDVVEGSKFNVLSKEKDIQFYLLVDLSRCKMWFYYIDLNEGKKHLLKTYNVSVGRLDPSKESGCLTPLGKFSLGNKVAIYKPKMTGPYQGKQVEMVTIFGTRWIPFDKALENCTAPAKSLGLHGVPWLIGSKGELIQDKSSIGKNQSDGCIRLASEDIEEIFSIIITRPSVIELVKDFQQTIK